MAQRSKNIIDANRLPKHIAIIMDGNGRWAKEQGKNRLFGHYHGVKSVRETVSGCVEVGIKYLTLYAFSTENWERPEDEVAGLMDLLVKTIRKELPDLNKNNVRIHVIGDMDALPVNAREGMRSALKNTERNTGLNLILALSYSSKWELEKALKEIVQEVYEGKLKPEEVSEEILEQHLTTARFPNPELMIRTGGEHRISNFLLYQLAYAELYFTNVHWPDFGKNELFDAIIDYQNRERRFGKTSEQVQEKE
ncbi:MAG: isoprenyl transferase [Chitinophagaceae bacterium]|jgi:undecaprenyl diphosphate synthase|nr:isoprenyl transferase [Chitinophagaceae bacterium]